MTIFMHLIPVLLKMVARSYSFLYFSLPAFHGSGTKPMVRTKWSEQNGTWTKWYRQKVYGYNQQSNSPAPAENDFFINPASTLIPLGFLFVFITYL